LLPLFLFESIHPFYDGNGRTGGVINVLYLIKQYLLNNIFRHPYTKIEFVTNEIQLHRNTATKYLEPLVRAGLLSKHKLGKDNFYLNDELIELFLNSSEHQKKT